MSGVWNHVSNFHLQEALPLLHLEGVWMLGQGPDTHVELRFDLKCLSCQKIAWNVVCRQANERFFWENRENSVWSEIRNPKIDVHVTCDTYHHCVSNHHTLFAGCFDHRSNVSWDCPISHKKFAIQKRLSSFQQWLHPTALLCPKNCPVITTGVHANLSPADFPDSSLCVWTRTCVTNELKIKYQHIISRGFNLKFKSMLLAPCTWVVMCSPLPDPVSR